MVVAKKSADERQLSVCAKILAAVFLAVGICAVCLAVYFSACFTNAEPALAVDPAPAQQQLQSMLDALCDGDFEQAASIMYGTPELGIDREADSEAAQIIWEAFVDSTEYALVGQCYATQNGLAQDLTFTCLDMTSVNKNLRDRSQTLLKERVDRAADVSEIYDENNEYREDVVNRVLKEAIYAALAEDAVTVTTTVTVYLKYENDRWWVVADQEFLDVLFGDVLFYSA